MESRYYQISDESGWRSQKMGEDPAWAEGHKDGTLIMYFNIGELRGYTVNVDMTELDLIEGLMLIAERRRMEAA